MKSFISFFFVGFSLAVAAENVSLFDNMKREISQLREVYKGNPTIDSLWNEANQIAVMNDRCGSISLTDVIDERCETFFAEELPRFESKFMEVSGEVRIGSLQVIKDVKDKATQITACVDALSSLYIPKGVLVKVGGGVTDLQPLNKDGSSFEAVYHFVLTFDMDRVNLIVKIGDSWLQKCGDVILTKTRTFSPLFLSSVQSINDSMARKGLNDVQIQFDGEELLFDESTALGGTYYLGGKDIFSTKGNSFGGPYLMLDVLRKKAYFPLENSNTSVEFSGKKSFMGSSAMTGRWVVNSKYDANLQIAKENARKQLAYERKFGSLIDERDGQNYRTILVNGKKWMAENLNYFSQKSFCYGNRNNCNEFGRLYTWKDARDACPKNWRLPTTVELGELQQTFSSLSDLMSNEDIPFHLKLSGFRDNYGAFKKENDATRLWSVTEYQGGRAYYLSVDTKGAYEIKSGLKNAAFSVRCVEE